MIPAGASLCSAEEAVISVLACWHAGIMADGPKDMKPLVEAFAKQVHHNWTTVMQCQHALSHVTAPWQSVPGM